MMQLQDKREKKDRGRSSAYFGMLLALSLIFSYLETLIPISFGIPGIKLGLANVVTVIILYYWGVREALVLAVLRNVLSGFLFGNLFAIFYSIAGSLASVFVMNLLKKRKIFSVTGVSIAGGVFHNIGQLIVAMLVVESFSISYYVPVLLIAGVLTGALIGVITQNLQRYLKKGRIR
jgi:heptaprenyl diphosphate synthase